MRESFLIKAGFVFLCLIWGSTWLAIKVGLDSAPPFYAAAIRFIVALPILFVMMKFQGLSIPTDRKSRNVFLAVGLLSFGLPFSLIYWSEQFLPSGLMSILFAIFPFVIAILSHLFLPAEPMNTYKLGGIILGFAGIVLIFLHGLQWDSDFAVVGMLGVVLATLFQGSGMIVIKKNGKDIHSITLNFVSMLIGLVPLITFAAIFENFSTIQWDAKAIGSILYLGTFGSVMTFAVYFWLLKRVQAVYLSLIAFMTPVTAVFLGAVILDEALEPNTFVGAALVLTGILIANGKNLKILIANSRK